MKNDGKGGKDVKDGTVCSKEREAGRYGEIEIGRGPHTGASHAPCKDLT